MMYVMMVHSFLCHDCGVHPLATCAGCTDCLPGRGVLVPSRVGDRRLVLVRQQGSLFALADHCPHRGVH